MVIATLDDYIAAVKTNVLYWKYTNIGANAYAPTSVFTVTGSPGTGTLSPGNTGAGIVPTDATDGYPMIPALSGSGYISKIHYSNIITCNMFLYDKLWVAGAYAFNSEVNLSAQPSYSGRLPGANYYGLELWFEAITQFTGTPTIQVQYLDQDGNTGDTGNVSLGSVPPANRMYRIPLATGDFGIQQITHVHATIATVGTFNIAVLRPLWWGRIGVAYEWKTDDMLKTGLPQIYADSALYLAVAPDATATQLPNLIIEVADK